MNEKPFGRPREYNREKIAVDIIEWAKKEDSININKFCAYYDPPFPARKLCDWAREDEDFRASYETAKTFMAFRREEWLNNETLHVKAYDLTAAAYDYILKEEKKDQAKFESSLKAQEVQQASEEHKALNKAVLDQLSSMQESARKIANNNTKTDCKSD